MKYSMDITAKTLLQDETLFAKSLSHLDGYECVIVWGDSAKEIVHDNIITINPAKTIQDSTLHIAIKPKRDFHLALLLSRFAIIENRVSESVLERFEEEIKDFYELTQTLRIKATLQDIGISLADIGIILDSVVNKKCAIVVGKGAMRYQDSLDALRAIEAFALLTNLLSDERIDIYYNVEFDRDDKSIDSFEFLDEIDIDSSDEEFYFIGYSDKISKNCVYIHSDFNHLEDEMIELCSDKNSVKLKVIIDDTIRRDCVKFSSDIECDDLFETTKYFGVDANVYKSYKLRMKND